MEGKRSSWPTCALIGEERHDGADMRYEWETVKGGDAEG